MTNNQSTLIEFTEHGTRIIQLNHGNKHNLINQAVEHALIRALHQADQDPSVHAVVIYGGSGRSFSAGGDFNEVSKLSDDHEVDNWIDRITALYSSLLKLKKPSVAAINGYAIGIGFQLAMMCDVRLMSHRSELRMPELKHGIGCAMGAAILDTLLPWNHMRDIVYGCESINGERALKIGLVNQVVHESALLSMSVSAASRLSLYPKTAFRATKEVINMVMLERLCVSALSTKKVHRAAFAAGDAQRHFQNILKEKYNDCV